ncbi:MAG: CoB--CoM heterodisulfide reductase iron-sulfur subunit B family protein [Ignavibacteriaceae bacterium]|nr:CoB--CoM heterodisulfide reductase iron-sulfur subunit B family protein [Ignavibacteriaceae bacterium]
MIVGYYPGCSLTGTGKEYDMSLRKVLSLLDVQVEEINDWCCCGATSAHATNHLLSVALPARNLMLAQKQNLNELLAPCAACYNRLIGSKHEISHNADLKKKVEFVLEEDFNSSTEVINIVQLLQKVGKEKIKSLVKVSLKDIKVACYYGCLLVRPNAVTKFDDAENPTSMEDIISATGALTVEWNYKTECCGGAHSIARKDIVTFLSKNILDDAKLNGAHVIVVACPMCHSNLDMRQRAIKKLYPSHEEIPVLYLSELIGIALGLNGKELGINLHFVDAINLLQMVKAEM